MILNESKRDDLLIPYVQKMAENGIDISLGKLKTELLELLVKKAGIRNLSLGSNFYLAGAAKYYFNGELTVNGKAGMLDGTADDFNEQKCKYLNEIILILRNAYVDSVGTKFELEENFGKLSLDKLIKKYNKKIMAALDAIDGDEDEEEEKPIDYSVGNKGYTFDVLYSYDDARKYYEATEPGAWCITYGERHYNRYIELHNIHYVIFRQNGYENVPRRKGANWSYNKPQDEYGNSLIALLQSNENGEPVYITSRWNHGDSLDDSRCEADHAYTKEEFLNVVGMNDADLQRIFQIWKQHKPKERKAMDREATRSIVRNLKEKQMHINGGQSPESVLGNLNPDYLVSGNGTWAKSVAVLRYESTNTPVYVLVDRGNILFETVVEDFQNISRSEPVITPQLSTAIEDNPEIGYRLNSWGGEEVKWARDVVVIKKRGYSLIYNTRLHQFVNVDGITKFKYTPDYISETLTDGFYEVAMGQKQRALISVKTNQPLKLPNGSSWYEYTGYRSPYGRGVHLVYSGGAANIMGSGILRIKYDSSPRGTYYYDTKLNKFIDVKRLIDNLNNDGEYWGLNLWKSFGDDSTPSGVMVFTDGREHYALSHRGQIMEINGRRKFDQVSFGHNYGLLYYDRDSGKREVVFYNFNQGAQIELPQGIYNFLVGQERTASLWGDYSILGISVTYSIFLFDTKSDQFLKLPTMEGFTYDFTDALYQTGRDTITLYLNNLQWLIGDKIDEYRINETWSYKLVECLISDLTRAHISTKDEIDNSRLSPAQRMNESVKINIGDIKAMVTEALSKILKRH